MNAHRLIAAFFAAAFAVQCGAVADGFISDVGSVVLRNERYSVPMRLIDDYLWMGAFTKAQVSWGESRYWFLDSDGVKRGDASATAIPSSGSLAVDAEFAPTGTVNTALVFQYDEAKQTYRIQSALYDPMRSSTTADPAWTRYQWIAWGTAVEFWSSGYFISPDCFGVGRVMFRAACVNNPVIYSIAVSKTENQDDWTSIPAVNGGTGVISDNNMRFFSAVIGDSEVRRVRVSFTRTSSYSDSVYVSDAIVTPVGAYADMENPQISVDGGATYADSATEGSAAGQIVEYGDGPALSVHVTPRNGATNLSVSVEAVTADIVEGEPVPVAGAPVASIPMAPVSGNENDGYVFRAQMPARTSGTTAYRFVADFEGEDATRTFSPATNGAWFSYSTDGSLDAIRNPDFSALEHDNSAMSGTARVDGWSVGHFYLGSSQETSIGFMPAAGETALGSAEAFQGIGRIYFQACCLPSYGPHGLEVQMSSSGGPSDAAWETVNTVSVPCGAGNGSDSFSQFCIEVNDYGTKYVRIRRMTNGADENDRVYVRDLVVTPPAANVQATIPSIVHPGYPSGNDDITFSVHVENVCADYPVANAQVTLRWRRVFGSVSQPWNATPMTSADGETFTATLPAMYPGRLEYYAEVSFDGAAYRYTYLPRSDGTAMPIFLYCAGDDTCLESDPRQGDESRSPTYLFSAVANPAAFSHTTRQRPLEAPTDAENAYLWFKIRPFASRHDHHRLVCTDASGTVATNAMRLVGDNLWLATLPVTNSLHGFLSVEGVAPYGGAGTTEYLAEPTVWGDDDQASSIVPFADCAGTNETGLVEIDLGTTNAVTLMVRFDADTGAYQIRRAAYQDFNGWDADTRYFEDSADHGNAASYELDFDDSPLYPETSMRQRISTFTDDVAGDYGASGYATADGWFLHTGAILRERKPHETSFPVDTNVSARIDQGGCLANGPGTGANDRGLDSVALRARVSYGADGHVPYDPSGFAWENYRLLVSNILVSAISDGNPYVQVMAAYRGPGDYIAVRLTQTATIDSQRGDLPHVRQDLIRVANGVENILSTTFTRKWNNGRGTNALTDNESSTQNAMLELSNTPQGIDWVVEIDMTSGGTVRARAFVPGGGTWTNNWLTATGVSTTGTISFDTFDARANFRNIYVVRDGVSSPVDTANWYLGGTQAGDSSATRWILEIPPGRLSQYQGVARPVPTLPFTIGVAKAGESATLPAGTPYETVGEEFSIASLSYASFSRSVRYWGNAFVRIQPGVSDARLVVDDIEVQDWRGRSLPETSPEDDGCWQAREAVVTTRDGTQVIALTTSRANPAARQMVSTPAMPDGIGSIAFSYAVEGGSVAFVVERNSIDGAYADDDAFIPVATYAASDLDSDSVYLPIREPVAGKVRIRVLPDESSPDATLYLGNFFAKGFPPDVNGTWTAYNALVVGPASNGMTDARQFEEDSSTRTAFLNNAEASDTRPNIVYREHLPFIQPPFLDAGVGEIAFWYRAWDPDAAAPGEITLWVAENGDAPDEQWRQITVDDFAQPTPPDNSAPSSEWDAYYAKLEASQRQIAGFQALSNVTNGDYRYFYAEICNASNHVLRICSGTNGTQRVAIDDVLVSEPAPASIDIRSAGLYSGDIPPDVEFLGFEVLLGDVRMNPADIHVYVDYYIGTNVWGVANWADLPETRHIELVPDVADPCLYRSSAGDTISGLPVDSVVQYRIRVTYADAFARHVTSAAYVSPEGYNSDGGRATDVSIRIVSMEIAEGKVVVKASVANHEPGKTVEGWSWGVRAAATLDALPDAEVSGGLLPLTDESIRLDLVKELDIGDDDASGFYRAVLEDGCP